MMFHPPIAACSGCILLLCCLTLSAPTDPAIPTVHTDSDLSTEPLKTPHSAAGALSPPWIGQKANSSDIDFVQNLGFFTVEWPITNTLSLTANIGPWRLPQEKILETLEAAKTTVGKKVASTFLDKTFTQKHGGRVNPVLFEIGPGFIYERLTWADVGEVLGENGLPRFFREQRYWTSTYFDVKDSVRGELGQGAVRRKWFQLELTHTSNNTALTSSDVAAA